MGEYEINAETLLIMPMGNGKSRIYEFDRDFVINSNPIDILNESCLFFGCSLEGRRDAVKNILGIDMKVPILVEDTRNIIFFPTTNCVHKNSIWISYQNLLKFYKLDDFSTVLYFCNNKQITVDIRYNIIDNQVIRCIKLESLLKKRKQFIKDECIIIDEKNAL